VIDAGRAAQGLAPLDGAKELLPKLYGLPSAFKDITDGFSVAARDKTGKVISMTPAKPGYDLVTGLGTPRADVLFNNLAYPFALSLSGGHLTVTGDQAGSPNDVFEVGNGAAGELFVTLNGATASFPAGVVKTLDLNTGSGANTVYVEGVPANLAVNVRGGFGSNDTVKIGYNGSLSYLGGPVSVSNVSGKTALTIDDSNDSADRMVTVTGSSVQFSNRPQISYSGISSLKVLTGAGHVGIFVNGTAAGTPLTLVTGGGESKVWVGSGSLAGIAGAINVQHSNPSGHTTLVVDDYKEAGRNAFLGGNAVYFSGVAPITYSGVSSVDVVGGGGANTIFVSVRPDAPTTVHNTLHNGVNGAYWTVATDPFLPTWDLINGGTIHKPGLGSWIFG
jgi:hypothetical protein